MEFNAEASYLKENEWSSISVYLEPFTNEIIKVSKELSLDFKCSQRWPSIELSRKKYGKIDTFKLSLNSSYLEDNQVFFEFIYNQFSKKIFGEVSVEKIEALGSYSLQDMQNFEFVLEDIKIKLTNKIKHSS